MRTSTCQWKDVHLLPKMMIIQMLPMNDALNLRLCSHKDQGIVDMSRPEIRRILTEIVEHSERDVSIVYLGGRSTPFENCNHAWYLNIQALFKGKIFENYNRITLPLLSFGMTYQFDDMPEEFYDGIYSNPIDRTDQGLIFNFHFTYSRFKKIVFSFYYHVDEIIYQSDQQYSLILESL